jgi:DNA polymerase-1
MVGEYLIRGQRKQEGIDLHTLSQSYNLPAKQDKTKLYWDAGYDTNEIPLNILLPYCDRDALNALLIYYKQIRMIDNLGLGVLASLEMETLRSLQEMEQHGMSIDSVLLDAYDVEYLSRLEELSSELANSLQIENPGSGEQLSKGLFGFEGKEGVFDPTKFKIDKIKKVGVYSTDVANMSKLRGSNPTQKRILELLNEHSRVKQLQSTYFKGLKKHLCDGDILHQSINQSVTRTGRTSCSRPNLQNVPRGNTGPVKMCFITRF